MCRADLANLVNEAALLAGRANKVVVEKIDFILAVERSIAVCFVLLIFSKPNKFWSNYLPASGYLFLLMFRTCLAMHSPFKKD